jgi:RNA polymerase sigma factor (sigma-70 family)
MDAAEAELIAKVLLDDDRHAFATLVRRHQSAVRGLLRRLTHGNEALADDLAQETFIKSYQALKSFRGGAKFSTWLHRIAYNTFISHVRGEQTTVDYDGLPAGEPAGREETQSINLAHDLQRAMRQLNAAERDAIQLCCQCGFSHGEAAEILKQPLGTVKTNVSRGKEKLRELLAAWQEVAHE